MTRDKSKDMETTMSEEVKKSVDTKVAVSDRTVSVAGVAKNQMLDLLKAGADWLPRLQLQTSGSQECKAGSFPVNHYALVRDQTLSDLGTELNVLVIEARMQALDFSDAENVVSSYDPAIVDGSPTGVFADIMERSSGKDSKCMWGTQFLVYVPAAKTFATILFGTKTSRRDAPAMMQKVGGACTLSAKKIPNKKFGDYYSLNVLNCSEPLDAPSGEEVSKEIEKFLNPPEKSVETVEKAPEQKQAR